MGGEPGVAAARQGHGVTQAFHKRRRAIVPSCHRDCGAPSHPFLTHNQFARLYATSNPSRVTLR